MILLSAVFAVAFAVVHVGIGWLSFLDRTPRSRWLSAAGGVAVAYVFLHILPELASHRATLAEALETTGATAEAIVYSVALAGLIVFYAMERLLQSARGTGEVRGRDLPPAGAFWLHIGTFATYNVIIGYLILHREEPGVWPLVSYGIAMSLHFVSSDFGLRKDHQTRYDRIARWILAAAVLTGWAIGAVTEVSELWIAVLFAFLGGGVVLNVLKEELPEERASRLLPFVGAAVGYGVLLFAG